MICMSNGDWYGIILCVCQLGLIMHYANINSHSTLNFYSHENSDSVQWFGVKVEMVFLFYRELLGFYFNFTMYTVLQEEVSLPPLLEVIVVTDL